MRGSCPHETCLVENCEDISVRNYDVLFAVVLDLSAAVLFEYYLFSAVDLYLFVTFKSGTYSYYLSYLRNFLCRACEILMPP